MKFRKKSYVVDAIQWDGVNRVEVARFIKGDNLRIDDELLYPGDVIKVALDYGLMLAAKGDWIIKESYSDIYSCKPDDFAEMFELE